MQTPLTLSVVDQSPIRRGETAADALRDTVELAKATDRLGYARYWVAEHHSAGTFAGTSPEILIGQILANTQHIRVGSGGVMLTHYASLKVAEQFRVLEAFYPGRVDLGIGRAPGSDQRTMVALAYPRRPAEVDAFPQQVADLVGYLYDALASDHPFADVKAAPGKAPLVAPQVWLLGSSDFSASLAAHLGLPFAFADFFGHTGKHGPAVAEIYRRNFRPSALCPEPKLNVALQVLCAPTAEEVHRVAASRNYNRARRVLAALGQAEPREGLLSPEEALSIELSDQVREEVAKATLYFIDGDPQQVRQGVLEAAERYETNDVSIVTITHSLEDRIRSYELIAHEFGLTPRE